MTPEQQTALAELMGRALTLAEVTAIDPLLDANNRNDVAITAWVNAGQSDEIGSLLVEDAFTVLFNTGDYATLKTAQLAGNPLAVMVFSMLEDSKKIGAGRVDVSSHLVGGLLDQLVAAELLTTVGKSALMLMAVRKSKTYSVDEVSHALNIAEGRMVL